MALRLLMPAGIFGKYLLPEFAVFLEGAKASVERSLSSVYSAAYTPIAPSLPLPLLQEAPQSVTDWLFVTYLAGVCFFLLKYLIGYLRLRGLLRHGLTVSEQQQAQLLRVCADHSLRPCPMVAIPRLPSALICGVFRPVLAIPAEGAIDDPVLLHELLHKRHYDVLQNTLWSILRALHWCNPLLQYAFSRIENDMECLCDQRVLERLDGEERRDYATILLAMTSERYPRVSGTSSLSNGGRSIARRMQATLRFKKYPRGMAIISLCIVAILLGPAVLGAQPVSLFDKQDTETLRPDGSPFFQQAMASARLRRATTIAGAVDTYAKALLYQNPVYLAAVTPFDAQDDLMEGLERGAFPLSLPDMPPHFIKADFSLYNLTQKTEAIYEGILIFTAEHTGEDGSPNNTLFTLPVSFRNEGGWTVTATGPFQTVAAASILDDYGNMKGLPLAAYEFDCQYGTLRMEEQTISTVNNQVQNTNGNFLFGPSFNFNPVAKPDAEFESTWVNTSILYTFTGTAEEKASLRSVGIAIQPISDVNKPVEFDFSQQHMVGNSSGASSNGSNSNGGSFTHQSVDASWDGVVRDLSGYSLDWNRALDFFPVGYAVQIYHNDKLIETVQILRGDAP